MKVHLVSDLHLEFCPIELDGGETLLLSGDITVAAFLQRHRTDGGSKKLKERCDAFFRMVSTKYKQAFYIAGNHEHYHGKFGDTIQTLRDFLTDRQITNITVLDNEAVKLTDKTMLFGATMWTDMNKGDPLAIYAARQGMNDFYLIKYGTSQPYNNAPSYHPTDSMDEHNITKNCLLTELDQHPDMEFLVMTHHTPSFNSVHPKYGNDPMNYAYSSDLSGLILDHPNIKNWVHGHTHDNFRYAIGECKVMCNPRGYTRNPKVSDENPLFDPNLTFEVA
jgi:hypothetical protein